MPPYTNDKTMQVSLGYLIAAVMDAVLEATGLL